MKAAALALLLLAAAPSDDVTLTATSVNVAQSGTPVKIRILRWSTDQERAPLMSALTAAPAPPPPEPARGRAAAAAGRGRGRGRATAAAPLTPIAAFTAALGRAPTIGYVWTSDITGYAIKYAWHAPLADGTERVILVSDRRLGAYTDAWKTAAPDTDYTFTLIDLRRGPKGLIEGKTSLTNKIAVDAEAKTVALENYTAAATSLAATSAAGKSPRPSR